MAGTAHQFPKAVLREVLLQSAVNELLKIWPRSKDE